MKKSNKKNKRNKFFFFRFVLSAVFIFFGLNISSAKANSLPTGHLDHASETAIFGWAYDADAGEAPITVHIYINGVPTIALVANQSREDLVAAGITKTAYHGFGWQPSAFSPGTYTVEAFGINVPEGSNPKLVGTKTLTITNRTPKGVLDFARPDYISGWAYDPDTGTNPVWVHIYIDGKHEGTVLADKKRADLVAAGIAPDPYHGFSWIPPMLSRGSHTINVWVINYPVGINSQLHSSPKTINIGDEYQGVAYLENSVVKVGVNLNWGGAITHISHQDTNLVDDNDTGRLAQVSLYDSGESYTDHTSSSWGWNPVQGGDKYNRGSGVLAFSQTPASVYVKSRPLQWNPDNKGGGATQTVTSEVLLEIWVGLSSLYPQLVEVKQRILLESGSPRTGNEEIPALFSQPSFNQLVSYQGSRPWTNDTVSNPTFSEFPHIETLQSVSERWASWVNTHGFGLTLYVPNHLQGTQMNAYWIDRVTNYLRPGLTTTLQPGVPWEVTYYLIVGNYYDARSLVYALQGQ